MVSTITKKMEAVVFITVMIGSSFVSIFSVNAEHDHPGTPEQVSDKITLNFSFSEPVITQVLMNGTIYDRVTMDGLPTMGNVGIPVLPVKPLNVLLPQREDVQTIDIIYKNPISLGQGFHVEIGTEYNQSNGCFNFDPAVPYPTEMYQSDGIYYFRGYSILTFVLFPVHYVEETGELYYYPEMTAKIKTKNNDILNSLFRGLHDDEMMMRQKVDNYNMSYTYVSYPEITTHSSLVDPAESYDYVIITSKNLNNSHGAYTFQDLMEYKNERGTRTAIVTVEDILEDPYYCNTTNHLFNDKPARIRNFIIDAYSNWGIEYVLLGGDSDIIPARYLYVDEVYSLKNVPSDLYYACLDGTFNSNWDNKWGEPTDGTDVLGGNGDVDLRAEIYIGRACVDNENEVSNFVKKTLIYENTVDSYLKEVWMAGQYIGFGGEADWGDNYLDELIDGSNHGEYVTVGIPSHEYTIGRLYDREWREHGWPPPSVDGGGWPKQLLIGYVNNGTHIINHVGNSVYDYNLKMVDDDVDALTNDKPCFIYSQTHLAGNFSYSDFDCIAEHFTVKSEHGAFAGIWNAGENRKRIGSTDDAAQRIDRQFWDAIFGESQNNPRMREIGVANQDSKEDSIFISHFYYLIRYRSYDTNLFGDPQVSLKPATIPLHDLSVNKLYITGYKHSHVPSNETLTFNTFIGNNGRSMEDHIYVEFTVDGTVVDTKFIHYLSRNSAIHITYNYSLSSGLHQIGVKIRPKTGENITCNNYLNRTVIAGSDVTVLNVEASPPLYIGCNNKINVTIENIGTNTVNNIHVFLKVDNTIIGENLVSSLISEESSVVSFNWVPQYSKWTNISTTIEPAVDECYTINNNYNETIHPVNHTVCVDDTGCADFRHIQDAIDWVGNEDTVYVKNGTYYERLNINKNISLIGENKYSAIIDGYNAMRIVSITADGVSIAGFTISNANYYGDGVSIRSKYNTVSCNIIKPCYAYGIDILSSNNLVSENVIINDINDDSCGILVQAEASFNYIFKNTIQGNGWGLGILLIDSNNNIIKENIIMNTTGHFNGGISLYSSFNNNIVKNHIIFNENGIWIRGNSGTNTFTENTITNNTLGINITYGNDNVFIGNTVADNHEGIMIQNDHPSEVSDNRFHHNNFFNNSAGNAYDKGSNIWDDEVGVGNYWDDFIYNPGYPSTYDIPGGDNQDRYPSLDLCTISGVKPNIPRIPSVVGSVEFYAHTVVVFETNTIDPDGDSVSYLFDWGDGTNSGWTTYIASGTNVTTSHSWSLRGTQLIRVKAKDFIGLESNWSDPLMITIINRVPEMPGMPDGVHFGGTGGIGYSYSYSSHANDPDLDNLYYWFEWGDGTCTGWLGSYGSGYTAFALHSWEHPGSYLIRVNVKDVYGAVSIWSPGVFVIINGAPEEPAMPSGSTAIQRWIDYEYTTSTTDPEHEMVQYMWDWGAGTFSDWLGPYHSNETAMGWHQWGLLDPGGTYYIRVKSRDIHGFVSVWSEPLIVSLPNDYPQPCFLAGTKVTMADGSLKNIEDVKVGDLVKSYNRIHKRFSGAAVIKVYCHTAEEMADYYVIINKDFKVTPNHPLLVDNIWTYAADIKIGAHLFGIVSSDIVIKSIEKVYKKVPTYNLDTEIIGPSGLIGSGTYFVQGNLVHSQKSISLIKDIEYWISQQGDT